MKLNVCHCFLGGADNSQMLYALTLAFVPTKGNEETGTRHGPLHGFLDDRLFVSLGVDDSQLATVELSIATEALRGIRGCARADIPAAFKPYLPVENSGEDEEEESSEHEDVD